MKTEMMAGGLHWHPNGDRYLQKRSMPSAHQNNRIRALMVFTKKSEEHQVGLGRLPGASRFTPVSVAMLQLLCFPLPLMPAKGFFVQQGPQFVPACYSVHHIHQQNIVINSYADFFENRGTLKLRGGYLVMTGS